MSHSGTWQGRTRMAWATWWLGSGMIIIDSIGYLMGRDAGAIAASGAGMVTLVVGIMVAGKVVHDKRPKDDT